ncbi:3-octaprenyl-4-hydroxybenzoate carboxy-lyase [Desulfovibrio sp. X2]|uniref:UbiX family flavin prenyltransferase n=1 Tax=Desulfovibrio sp. X2 TaxID=941449 RepID=UPI000358EDF0|nr:UbiX family flavin prenyltransferase [Desulfovibrio sp. X2]EPR37412.1 3-octaprenyl-4-hydroxybenzoate carboxy-lyase [Desulfovibrio sp. X2]
MNTRTILLAVTGASGMPYAVRLARALAAVSRLSLHVIVSNAARRVLELEAPGSEKAILDAADVVYREDEFAASPASGSWLHDGMVICPCSMKTLAAVATGLGTNLVHRAADVALKERRRLILVTRETPLSLVHIENMAAATRAGATIMPACPGFYSGDCTVDGLVDFMAARVLDHLGIPQDIMHPWNG